MSFFSKLGKVAGAVAQAAAPVVIASVMPEAMVNVGAGAAVKHGTPINNNAIPFLNIALSTAVSYGKSVAATGDWTGSIAPALQHGVTLAAVSTGLHQSLKIPLRGMIGGAVAKKVGPGSQFSL